MILHRIIGMSHRNFVECRITRCFGCPKQKFKVHHIIYNNRILPFISIMIPGTNTTDHRVKTRGQRVCPLQQYLFIFIRLLHTVSVAITTIEHKTQIMSTLI